MKDKVAIVTGASRGIGKAIAKKLLDQGMIVYGIGRDAGEFDTWADEYENLHPRVGDIRDKEVLMDLIRTIKKEHGELHALVNNAGIEFNEAIGMINADHMRAMFEVNVFALIELLQLSSRIMKKGASIVNISSNVGLKGNPGQLVYSATKGAVNSVTLTAAKELGRRGIRVNSVLPGLTNTEMLAKTDQKFLDERISNISLGKIIEPENVADMVSFLCSPEAEMVSGQLIAVDGSTIM